MMHMSKREGNIVKERKIVNGVECREGEDRRRGSWHSSCVNWNPKKRLSQNFHQNTNSGSWRRHKVKVFHEAVERENPKNNNKAEKKRAWSSLLVCQTYGQTSTASVTKPTNVVTTNQTRTATATTIIKQQHNRQLAWQTAERIVTAIVQTENYFPCPCNTPYHVFAYLCMCVDPVLWVCCYLSLSQPPSRKISWMQLVNLFAWDRVYLLASIRVACKVELRVADGDKPNGTGRRSCKLWLEPWDLFWLYWAEAFATIPLLCRPDHRDGKLKINWR